jgi:hypothetical protein
MATFPATHVTFSPFPTASATPENLDKFITVARLGEVFVYHRGYLPIDTDVDESKLSENDRYSVIRNARLALDAFQRGRVMLFQRRHGDFNYEYLAVHTGRRPFVAPTEREGAMV